jgi:DNA topoisomerase-2
VVAGTNGVGSVLTNVFSKKFIVSTCDGKKSFYQEFSNNMRDRKEPIIKSSKTNHTEIKYTPDYEKFGLDELNDEHLKIIEKRVYDIAACNSKLKIYFNGDLIDIPSFDNYILHKSSQDYYTTGYNTRN